jgi:hypothetical protein
MDWDTGVLLSGVRFSSHPDESPEEGEHLRQASTDLRQRGCQWVVDGNMFNVIAPYPLTLPQLCHLTRCAFLGYEAKRDVAKEDASWRLEVVQNVQKSHHHLWASHHNLMAYIHLQPKSGFVYDVTLYGSTAQMMLVRSIRVHEYELASKSLSSTWIDDLSRTRTRPDPSWAGGFCAEDLLQEQHRRCIGDAEKLQAILDLEQG